MTQNEVTAFAREMRIGLIDELLETAAIADQTLQCYRSIFEMARGWKKTGEGPSRLELIELALSLSAKCYQDTSRTAERIDDIALLLAQAQNLDRPR